MPAIGFSLITEGKTILFVGGDTNLYGYVQQNPINFTDPLGLWSVKLRYYSGYGGSVTIGSSGGKWFGSIGGGVGLGAGISYNPNGKPFAPPKGADCDKPTAFIGPSAWLGASAGPANIGWAGYSGGGIGKGANDRPVMGHVGDSGAYGTLSGKKIGLSLGGAINFVEVGISQ